MGIYVNPGNEEFKRAVNSKIYVDKTLKDYHGRLLLVGINYRKAEKTYTCRIETETMENFHRLCFF